MCWQKASACAGSLLESLLRVIFSQAEVCAKTASTGPAAAAAVAAPDQKLPAKRTRIGTPATTRTATLREKSIREKRALVGIRDRRF